MAMTISQKILAKACSEKKVQVDEIISAEVDKAMSHENAALVSKIFKSIGVKKVWDNERIIMLFDHRVPANTIKTANAHKIVREFVKQHDIKHFYDLRAGVCHQIMPEFGHVLPGELIAGTDSHTTTYGAFGAFSTGIGATEMAGVWATGELWLKVPPTLKIIIEGKFPKGVYPKDLILHVIGDRGASGASYKALEFYGKTMEDMSLSGRMTICNMCMEMDAKAGIVPPDKKTVDYLAPRSKTSYASIYGDDDAYYEEVLKYNINDLKPQIACPHRVDNVKSIDDVEHVKIDQAVLGSCTNGRIDDLRIAAEIIGNKEINKDVRFLIIPASTNIYLQALKEGLIESFIKAGGVVLNPGCGPCMGAHQGILADEEVAITTTNRNFKGRMGSISSKVYLASPATVAASALNGEITDPRRLMHD